MFADPQQPATDTISAMLSYPQEASLVELPEKNIAFIQHL
jgi:hypothetical protein